MLFFLLLPFKVQADPDQEPRQPALVDRAHQEISDRLDAPSRWFDNFFSDPRSDEEAAGTQLRLRGSTTFVERDGVHFNGDIKVRLRLPNVKRRLHLILSSEDEDVRKETLKDARVNRELADQKTDTSLALRYTQERSSTLSLTHHVGADLEDGFNPRLRSRVRYTVPVAEQSLLSLTQAVFWEKKTGFGEESRIDFDLPLKENMLLRTSGQGLYSETSQGYEWLTMLQLLTSFSQNRALAIGTFTVGETDPKKRAVEYDIFIKYRQRIFRQWLFIELKPEIYWHRNQDFRATSLFTLNLEIQFGE